MEKIANKHLTDIFSKINEDDESYLKFAKEIGRVAYCLHTYYRESFDKIKHLIAKFYRTMINKRDDY
jgi:lambda repressor-like predicted transcriptional regulator